MTPNSNDISRSHFGSRHLQMKQNKLKVDFDTSLSAINPMEASVGIEAAANPVNTTEQAAMARFWSAMSREVDKKAKDDAALEVDLFAKADTHTKE